MMMMMVMLLANPFAQYRICIPNQQEHRKSRTDSHRVWRASTPHRTIGQLFIERVHASSPVRNFRVFRARSSDGRLVR